MAITFLNRIEGDFDDNGRFNFDAVSLARRCQILELCGKVFNLDICQARIRLSYGQEFVAGFVAYGEGIVAEHFASASMSVFDGDDDHIEGSKLFL